MKGDFSRNTFDPQKHFSRVLMQQGRVQLDADWNEQVSILLHYMQTLAADLIGPHGGPDDILQGDVQNVLHKNLGFDIIFTYSFDRFLELSEPEKDELKKVLAREKFLIGKGRYYVDGVLCENDDYVGYSKQPDYPLLKNETVEKLNGTFLVYLDVWERDITCVEDDDNSKPSICEVALGGPDTATREKVVWQVKLVDIHSLPVPVNKYRKDYDEFLKVLREKGKVPIVNGQLKAMAINPTSVDADYPCTISPEAGYRGAENQLYRVEIHTGSKDNEGSPTEPTFKWSRENGSVVFPIREPLQGSIIKLEHLGRDSRFGLAVGDWVEIVDDDYTLQGRAEPLLQVDKIDPINMEVTLKGTPISNVGQDPLKHPLLRRWDHKAGDPSKGGSKLSNDGTVEIKESKTEWLTLEDGVQIQFQTSGVGPANMYRTGDYWLIPARTTTGDIEWPKDYNGPIARAPHGVEHHYAPLAIVTIDGNGITGMVDLRRRNFTQLSS